MIYRFGNFSLNTDSLELTAGSNPITAEPQALLLLQYLIENRDRVVSRDDVFDAVWDGRIVSDSALTYAVKEARRIIGDDGKTQSMIRTLPRRGFRFVANVSEESAPTRGVPSANRVVPSDEPSIAVLAFENMSGDPEQDYFSDGMAEDLITDISKISGLFVAARNSSFAFKGKAVDVQEIAERLSVKFILEGSVRKMASRLRVNAQLIDAGTGGHVWAERYDGDLENIFDFQDDIREQIVSALKVSLTVADRALADRRPTESVEAYDLYLKGRAHVHHYTPEHMLEAIKCLKKAIGIDPSFADAFGYLSYGHILGWVLIWPGFDDSLARGNEFAERAVALDGASAMAVLRLAWARTYARRYEEAEARVEDAMSLGSDSPEFYAMLGITQNWLGHPNRGLEYLERAIGLDTSYPPTWDWNRGHSHLLLRQYDKAETRLLQVIQRAPKFAYAYVLLAWAYVGNSHLEKAEKAIHSAITLNPRLTVREFARVVPYKIDEDRAHFLDALRKTGLREE